MSASGEANKTYRRSRPALMSAVAVAVALALLLRPAGGPERLPDLPGRQVLAVHNGLIYARIGDVAAGDGGRLVIGTRPVGGGEFREIFRDEQFAGEPSGFTVTDKEIHYWIREPAPAQPRSTMGSSATPPARRPTHFMWERTPRVRMRRAPLAGGRPSEVLPDRRALHMHVSGDWCFWIESELTGPGKPLWRPINWTPRNTLHVAPCGGGPDRKVAVLPHWVGLWRVGNGVGWLTDQPHEHPQAVIVRAPEFTPIAIPDYFAKSLPLELDDHLYWADAGGRPILNAPNQPHRLLRAKSDGSGREVILDRDTSRGEDHVLESLFTDGSYLYFKQNVSSTVNGESRPWRASLVRLHPDGGERKALVTWAPGQTTDATIVGKDGEYLYYTASRFKENWLDWSARSSPPRLLRELYRVRLPR